MNCGEQCIIVSHNTVTNRRMFTETHFHDNYEIYYLLDGSTTYFIGDEICYIRPGSFVFIPKGVLHKTDSKTCLNNERFLININAEILDEDIKSILNRLCAERVVYIPKAEFPLFRELTDRIENEYSADNPFKYTFLKHCISELLVLIYRKKNVYRPALSDTEKIMQSVAEYISKHFAEEITLKSLAGQFAMSESYLSRTFKKICGIGICEYLTNIRITNAKKLLKTERTTVSDTAFMCGFNDSNYFSTVFKRLTGKSPLAYSKSYGNTSKKRLAAK